MRTQGEEFSLLTELSINKSNKEIPKTKSLEQRIQMMCIEKQWDVQSDFGKLNRRSNHPKELEVGLRKLSYDESSNGISSLN